MDDLHTFALPGESHPAIERYREAIRAAPEPRNFVKVRVQERSTLLADGLEPIQYLTFRRRQGYQSLEIHLGAYVWDVWEDQYGRMLTIDDYATWFPSLDAIMYGEYNPEFKGDI